MKTMAKELIEQCDKLLGPDLEEEACKCPKCGSEDVEEDGDKMKCGECGEEWKKEEEEKEEEK